MHDKTPYLLFASAAALSLALSQAALAQTPAAQAPAVVAPPAPAIAETAPAAPAAPAATPAPVAPAPEAAAPSPAPVAATDAPAGAPGASAAAAHADAAAKRMEERRAEMMAKRKQRYEELRKRAETAGLSLPESPPWDEAGFTPPEMPEMPEMPAWASHPGMEGLDQEWMARHEQAMQAMRERAKQRASAEGPDQAPWNMETAEEHRAHMEKMRNATPEERAALRDQHWAEMRERAAAKGVTLPETPPWKEAEQRREARKAQWESYRKIVDEMSAEQREAAEAMFGQPPMPPMPPMGRDMSPPMPPMNRDMNPPMPYGQDFGAPPARPYPPANANPGMGGPGYQGPGQPWSGGYPAQMPAPMMMPNSGYNRW